MKFIEVTTIGGLRTLEKSTKKYININHIIFFNPYHLLSGEIDYNKTVLKLMGEKDLLIIKANFENFKDNIIKLHSNHTHIV